MSKVSRAPRALKVLDSVVVGTGPAGLTASLYLARGDLSVVAFKDKEGSNLLKVPRIANLYGFPGGISGPELIQLGERHAKKYGAQLLSEEVLSCKDCSLMGPAEQKKYKGAKFLVKTQKALYPTRTVVIASGMQIRSGGIENEFKYFGKGVAVCVACDGPFFKKKKVMVVGAGNLAANEALELTPFTKDIVINTHGANIKMDAGLRTQLKKQKISIINKKIAAVLGSKWLEWVEYMDGSREKVEGVFLAMGTASAIDFARSLGLEMAGNSIQTNQQGRTNVPNVWAAGDVTGPPRQVGKSIGDGVRAAINIIETIRGGAYVDHRED